MKSQNEKMIAWNPKTVIGMGDKCRVLDGTFTGILNDRLIVFVDPYTLRDETIEESRKRLVNHNED